MTAAEFGSKAAPWVVAWLAIHAVVLAAIVLLWGGVLMLKVALGWLFHNLGAILVLATGIWLFRKLARSAPVDLHRAV